MQNLWQNEENIANNFLAIFSKKYNINYQLDNKELVSNIINQFYKELDNFLGRKINFFAKKSYYDIRGNFKDFLKKQALNQIIESISCIDSKKQKNYYKQLKSKLWN